MRAIPKDELQQYLKELNIYGYCHIPAYLGAGEVESLKSLVLEHYRKTEDLKYAGRPARDVRDKMVYNLAAKDKRFIDILGETSLRSLLMAKLNDPFYRVLPPEVPNYYLTYYNARSSGEALPLHIDSNIPAQGDCTWNMQVVFVLEDHTMTNGCTVVVPGSHLIGKYTDRELKGVKPLLPKAGDLVLWDSRLWHGTLENTGAGTRWSLVATFGMWWVKPSMDLTQSLPEEIYCQLSDEQKALMGFCCIPPGDELNGILTKRGYDYLKPSVKDYHRG